MTRAMRKLLPAALFACVTVAGCGGDAPPTDAVDATASDDSVSVYAEAVANPTRLEADYARDAGRKPAEVLEFFGIGAGDTVLDLFSGGGYYSDLLSHVVGPDGRVIAHTNAAYIGFAGDEFEARHAQGRLPNVDVLIAENNELELDDASLDAVIIILGYHDLYYAAPQRGWPKIDVELLLGELHSALKPGGVLGIVDHYAEAGAPRETGGSVHRIDPAAVIADLQAAGFVLEAQSDVLRNPDDDYSKIVFDPELRGRTDRFVLRFRKPD